ncbi:MAG: hypothetical protein INR69_06365 [Mucilaginibacter polytrichastri]|nr:hypothetical protein [Mucilaginibacter polytrichastri]
MKRISPVILSLCIFLLLQAFIPRYDLAAETQTLLLRIVAAEDPKTIKSQKIEITPGGFLRFRKNLSSGKSEYFSLHLSRYKELNYTGSEESGWAEIIAADSSVIVQTFNDKKGNIDSMGVSMRIPFRNCSAEDLSMLHAQFSQLKTASAK